MSEPAGEELIELGFRNILTGLGLDLTLPHLKDTPRRAARAWYRELCRGLTQPTPDITTFDSDVDEMIMLRHVPIRSVCAHHLLPFVGKATIAYIPGRQKIIGLSKLSRIADYWARRPQIQENLTAQIADQIAELVMGKKPVTQLEPILPQANISTQQGGGVGVIIKARHMCMELRGVGHTGDMVTSALRGVFLSGDARIEFLRLAEGA